LMDSHHEECLGYPVDCTNGCEEGKGIPRGKLAKHLSSVCPKQLINCPLKDYGCKILGKRKRDEMKDHMTETTNEHMLLLIDQIETLKRNMRQKLDNESLVQYSLLSGVYMSTDNSTLFPPGNILQSDMGDRTL